MGWATTLTRADVTTHAGSAGLWAGSQHTPLLSYHLLRPHHGGPAGLLLLAEAYRVWAEVWRQTLYELDNARGVPSDEFTRQDEVGALFHGSECVGLTAYRWVDVAQPVHRDDSYFTVWPSEAMKSATAFGTRLCICSNLTVASPWRAGGGQVKELLVALAVERFLKSGADALTGTPRNDRGINGLTYRLGFNPLARGVIHHGVPIDLVAFFRKTCARPPLAPATEAILQAIRPK